MDKNKMYDALIIGGSYSGLSAALALGRSLRQVLIIDSGTPCNKSAPHSHNFLTRDGSRPEEITRIAKEDVLRYPGIDFMEGNAVYANKTQDHFTITLEDKSSYTAKKIIIASGIKDIMPEPVIPGFNECWGISILHCPYCHGYEFKNKATALFANGEAAYDYAQMISNWTDNITILTNGSSEFSKKQSEKLKDKKIPVIEKTIASVNHVNGYITSVTFQDNEEIKVEALYAHLEYEQASTIPIQLGCKFTETDHIKIDEFHHTNINGVFAVGDAASMYRSISNAISAGTIAATKLNKDLIEEAF